jgi:hypothetical protein
MRGRSLLERRLGRLGLLDAITGRARDQGWALLTLFGLRMLALSTYKVRGGRSIQPSLCW